MSTFVRIIDEVKQTIEPDKCLVYKGWMSTVPRTEEQIIEELNNKLKVFIVTLVTHRILPAKKRIDGDESEITIYVKGLT